MANRAATINRMPPPKDQGGAGGKRKPPNRTPAYLLNLRIDLELGEAFEEYLESSEPTPSKTAAVEAALKAFLRATGFWPRQRPGVSPPSPEGSQDGT